MSTPTELASQALKEIKGSPFWLQVFTKSPTPCAIVSIDGTFMDANESLLKFLEYTHGELVTKKFEEITHPGDTGLDWNELKRLQAGEIDRYSMYKRYITKSNKVVEIILTVFPIIINGTIVCEVAHICPCDHGIGASIKDVLGDEIKELGHKKKYQEKIASFIVENWKNLIVFLTILCSGIYFVVNMQNSIIENNKLSQEVIEAHRKNSVLIQRLLEESEEK